MYGLIIWYKPDKNKRQKYDIDIAWGKYYPTHKKATSAMWYWLNLKNVEEVVIFKVAERITPEGKNA